MKRNERRPAIKDMVSVPMNALRSLVKDRRRLEAYHMGGVDDWTGRNASLYAYEAKYGPLEDEAAIDERIAEIVKGA